MPAFNTAQLARFILSFSWIYHGLIPKLITIAPLEMQMTSSLGFDVETTEMLIRLAGISEVIFGVILWFFYQNRKVILLNIAGLVGLLGMVIIQTPHLLLEAFNPITTNLPLIVLGLILIKEVDKPSNRH